ncbi:uncharacterized protein LOC143169689 isoform X1 [Aptenodytes patagonicus]|uniref:uncharacterized protein LOC143169689 isoform X1 n=1 Tax=Aptenodytes patagonicus TaxID=9234 RepID=UPI003FA05D24
MRHLTLTAPAPGRAPALYSFTARGLSSGYHSDGTAATPSASPCGGGRPPRSQRHLAALVLSQGSSRPPLSPKETPKPALRPLLLAAVAVVPLRPALFARCFMELALHHMNWSSKEFVEAPALSTIAEQFQDEPIPYCLLKPTQSSQLCLDMDLSDIYKGDLDESHKEDTARS